VDCRAFVQELQVVDNFGIAVVHPGKKSGEGQQKFNLKIARKC